MESVKHKESRYPDVEAAGKEEGEGERVVKKRRYRGRETEDELRRVSKMEKVSAIISLI